MAKIENKTRRDIVLLTKHVIPREGFIDKISNETIRCPDNWPMLQGLSLIGDVVISFDKEPDPEDASKMIVAKAPIKQEPQTPAPDIKPVTVKTAEAVTIPKS